MLSEEQIAQMQQTAMIQQQAMMNEQAGSSQVMSEPQSTQNLEQEQMVFVQQDHQVKRLIHGIAVQLLVNN